MVKLSLENQPNLHKSCSLKTAFSHFLHSHLRMNCPFNRELIYFNRMIYNQNEAPLFHDNIFFYHWYCIVQICHQIHTNKCDTNQIVIALLQ